MKHAKNKNEILVLLRELTKTCGLIALDNVDTTSTVCCDSDLWCQVVKTRLEPPVPSLG